MKLTTSGEGITVCQAILELLFGKIEQYHVDFKDGIVKVFNGTVPFDIEIIYATGRKLTCWITST